MLAAGSFSSPYEHLSQPETKRMVEHYTAYLSDNTRLIANPGLKVHKHTSLGTHLQLTAKTSLKAHTHSNTRVNVVYLTNTWHTASPAVRLHICTKIPLHECMYKYYNTLCFFTCEILQVLFECNCLVTYVRCVQLFRMLRLNFTNSK